MDRRLRDDLMAFTGESEQDADEILAAVSGWWAIPPEKLAAVVGALAGTWFRPGALILWAWWTALVARTPNGGEMILRAAWLVAKQRGIAPELLAALVTDAAPPAGSA
jgi:hypothetical protein